MPCAGGHVAGLKKLLPGREPVENSIRPQPKCESPLTYRCNRTPTTTTCTPTHTNCASEKRPYLGRALVVR
jgi:hypothetical protein